MLYSCIFGVECALRIFRLVSGETSVNGYSIPQPTGGKLFGTFSSMLYLPSVLAQVRMAADGSTENKATTEVSPVVSPRITQLKRQAQLYAGLEPLIASEHRHYVLFSIKILLTDPRAALRMPAGRRRAGRQPPASVAG